MFEVVGIAGIAISVGAYIPQVVHLWREHCSAGVSSRAWVMWLTSALLVGLLAMERGDPVFILLQASSLLSAALILFLARKYRGMACETHASPASTGYPANPQVRPLGIGEPMPRSRRPGPGRPTLS